MIAIARAWKEGRITRAALPREVLAGVVVGVVAIPLAMAFAIASGDGLLKPEQGIYTAIIAGLLVALFGGAQVQIAGPTGAFIVVLLGVVHDHGVAGLQVAGLMAGVILVVLGVSRLGRVIRYIPHPVTMGFTAGIGVIIFTGQIKDFLGLTLHENPRDFVEKVLALGGALGTTSAQTAVIAAFSLLVIVFFPRVTRRIPPALVGMLAGTALYLLWKPDGVATIGTAFGSIPSGLPSFHVPDFEWSKVGSLLGPAFTIALLGAIESLLSAVVADGMTGDTHDSDQELIGQGIANVAAPLFGGFPATGAIARTATNIRNGGRTPIAGLVHCGTLVLVLLLLAPYAVHIPLATLAAILFVVAWNMSEMPHVVDMLRSGTRSDKSVLLVTFGLTVFVDLVAAVEVGVVLAALLFVKHMSERVGMGAVLEPEGESDPFHSLGTALPPEIAMYSVDGPFFFGVSHRFEATVSAVDPRAKIVIVRLWRVPYLDASGENSLRRVVEMLGRSGRVVVLSGVKADVQAALQRSHLAQEIGEERIWGTLEEALAYSRNLVVEMQLAT